MLIWPFQEQFHFKLFHDGGHYHIETSPLICRANQWTGFSMITASVMKELRFICKAIKLRHKNYVLVDSQINLRSFGTILE